MAGNAMRAYKGVQTVTPVSPEHQNLSEVSDSHNVPNIEKALDDAGGAANKIYFNQQ